MGLETIHVCLFVTPQADWDKPALEKAFAYTMTVVNRVRKLRADYGLTRQRPEVWVACSDAATRATLEGLASEVATLTGSGTVCVVADAASGAVPSSCSVGIVDDATSIHMLLKVRP